jgi:hypothetical protein
VERVEADPLDLEFELPPELEGDVYANVLSAWHSPHEFTLDFGVTHRLESPDRADFESELTRAGRVVGRIRIPLTLMFDFIREMNGSLTHYEQRYGEIRKPEER